MRALLILLGLLVAGAAAADDYWYTTSGGSARAERLSMLRPGQSAYFQETASAQDDSKVLDVSNCTSFTALFIRTGALATAFLMDNFSPSSNVVGDATVADSTKVLNGSGNLDLTGDPATGLAYIYNVVGVYWIWVDMTADPGGTDSGTMRITCYPPT